MVIKEWTNLPIYKFLIIYIISILLGRYTDIWSWEIVYLAGLLVLILSLILYKFINRKFSSLLFLLSLPLLFLSYYEYRTSNTKEGVINLRVQSQELDSFYGRVSSYPKVKEIERRGSSGGYGRGGGREGGSSYKRQEYVVKVEEIRLDGLESFLAEGDILVKSRYILEGLELGDYVIIMHKTRSVKELDVIGGYGGFDYRQYLEDRGISYLSYPYRENQVKKLSSDGTEGLVDGYSKFVNNIRDYLSSKYASRLSKDVDVLLQAMILGKREGISSEMRDIFKEAGIMHVLAISGMHVGMIGLTFYILLRILGLKRRVIIIVVGVALIVYMGVVGYKASILRAVIMYFCFILVLLFDRDKNHYNSLFVAAFISLLIDPLYLFHISYQLSFLATFGILTYGERLNLWFRKILYRGGYKGYKYVGYIIFFLVGVLSMTLSAQVFIIPVIIYYFKGYSLVGFLANILIVPLVQGLVILAIVFSIVTSLSIMPFPSLAQIIVRLIEWLGRIILDIAQYSVSMSWAYVTIQFEDIWLYMLFIPYYVFLMFLYDRIKGIKLDVVENIN